MEESVMSIKEILREKGHQVVTARPSTAGAIGQIEKLGRFDDVGSPSGSTR